MDTMVSELICVTIIIIVFILRYIIIVFLFQLCFVTLSLSVCIAPLVLFSWYPSKICSGLKILFLFLHILYVNNVSIIFYLFKKITQFNPSKKCVHIWSFKLRNNVSVCCIKTNRELQLNTIRDPYSLTI